MTTALDSGAVTRLSGRTDVARNTIRELRRAGEWPPVVPSVVLVESLHGDAGRDAPTNQFLRTCRVEPTLTVRLARRAAELRRLAGRGSAGKAPRVAPPQPRGGAEWRRPAGGGSAVDAAVAATAEPGGVVLTGDVGDLRALAAHARDVAIERI